MKVLHIFNSLMPSGAEVMWWAARDVLRDEGVETHVLATRRDLGPFADKMKAGGYFIHHIPLRTTAKYFDWQYCKRVYKLIKSQHFDAVHVHPDAWRLTNVVIAWSAGIQKISTTIHSTFLPSRVRRVRRPIIFWIMKFLGCRVISIGDSVCECEKHYHYTPEIIWNWVDLDRFKADNRPKDELRRKLGIPLEKRILITVANCAPVKNHEFLFRVMRKMSNDYVLIHVGVENEDETHEREHVSQMGLAERVLFLGKRIDVPDLLQSADLYVMCSTREGFGISTVEALAIGLPAVVSDVPGLRDLAKYIPLCSKAPLEEVAFARKIEDTFQVDESRRPDLLRRSREIIEKLFSMERNVRSYISLWR